MKKSLLKQAKDWAAVIVVALVLSFIFRTYVAEAVVVPSGSMLPTIQLQDHIFVEKFTGPSSLKDGDIIVFYPPVPGQENNRFIKRLIGVGGDTIQIKDHQLYRNRVKVTEAYVKHP